MPVSSVNINNPEMSTVEVGNKLNPQYYNIPKDKADEFTREYKSRDKKNQLIYNTALIFSALAGVLLVNAFSKKLNTLVRFLLNMAGGVSAAFITAPFVVKHTSKKQEEIINKYNAEINNNFNKTI